METKFELPTFLASVGAIDFSAQTEVVKTTLTRLLDRQSPVEITGRVFKHSEYLARREQLVTSATLATLAGDSRLEQIVGQWAQLQTAYAHQVIKEAQASVQQQQELIKEYDQELLNGEVDRRNLSLFSSKNALELTDSDFDRIRALRKKIAELDVLAADRQKLHRSVEGVSRVQKTLETLAELGIASIHYIAPSIEGLQKQLGENTYTGPEFSPFTISARATITDIFSRDSTLPSIRPNDPQREAVDLQLLPPQLTELWKVYEHVSRQPLGDTIVPADVHDHLKIKELGVKGIANYFNDHEALFGVKKRDAAGSRTFTRQQVGTPMDKKAFIDYILRESLLQQVDATAVSKFYFEEALALLREQPAAYEGFTKETVAAIAANEQFPVTSIYIARNLSTEKSREAKGIIETAPEQGAKLAQYRFRVITPTDRQVEYVQAAVSEFGISRFSILELTKKVTNRHPDYRILPAVAEKILDQQKKDWNLRVACNNPLQYQRETGTSSTKEKKINLAETRLM